MTPSPRMGGSVPGHAPRWLELLARCLQRYVEQHPERFAIVEDAPGPRRVRRVVPRGTDERA
jgi:hypothetical protein